MVQLLDVFVINMSRQYNLKLNSCLDVTFQTGISTFFIRTYSLLFSLNIITKHCIRVDYKKIIIQCDDIFSSIFLIFFIKGKNMQNFSCCQFEV